MGVKKRAFSILFLIFSVTVPIVTESAGQAGITPDGRKKLLELINRARQSGCRCGADLKPPAPPVSWDTRLETAAAGHSADMEKNGFMGHDGSDGSSFSKRIREAGFDWSKCAENVAQGYTSEEQVVEGWLKSPPHCRNIMDPAYRFIGVARSGTSWTLDLGETRENQLRP